MYYQEGLTQETIAKKLRTSRPAVSLLLAEARKTGVVQIKIKDPEVNNEELAGQFQKRFGLKKCLVIPCGIRQEECGAEDRGLASGQVCQQNDEKPYHGRHLMGRLLL